MARTGLGASGDDAADVRPCWCRARGHAGGTVRHWSPAPGTRCSSAPAHLGSARHVWAASKVSLDIVKFLQNTRPMPPPVAVGVRARVRVPPCLPPSGCHLLPPASSPPRARAYLHSTCTSLFFLHGIAAIRSGNLHRNQKIRLGPRLRPLYSFIPSS